MSERRIFFGTDWRSAIQDRLITLEFIDVGRMYFDTKEAAKTYLQELKGEIEEVLECLEKYEDEA